MLVSADGDPCRRACLSPLVAESSAHPNEVPACPLTRVYTKEGVVLLV